MYLNELSIVNFRNYSRTKFTFGKGANTVTGENDVGKSNAMTALRILLDDAYYYNIKRLRESDFSETLEGEWKGNWIIISAIFAGISESEKESDVCAGMINSNEESIALANSLIKSGDNDYGTITLFIRPQMHIRKILFDNNGNIEEFNKLREQITISDYEFYYTSRATTDFTSIENYERIVGKLDEGQASNPEEDDILILGTKVNISDIQEHISLVYIDALRDVMHELHSPQSPIRKIVQEIQTNIKPDDIQKIKESIKSLNTTISNVQEINKIGQDVNRKLMDIIGLVYSPNIALSSELSDELKSLSKYLMMKPEQQEDINSLGLGHLNIIYMALKIIEYETCRSKELINIMIIEEPEAHIHAHIQKTLFDNLSISKDYTQIIMTTHSAHLAESSKISRMNVVKSENGSSIAMNPSNNLNDFGKSKLKASALDLVSCVERYLDSKRNILLFSKGVILVEGDGEEILIPNMFYKAFGIHLDELGIGLINVGSTAFEYVASLFHDDRIHRYCAIVTDLDKQAVPEGHSLYKAKAEKIGRDRKDKLDSLFEDNQWVSMFYAEHTLEVEFVNSGENNTYVEKVIEKIYSQKTAIESHKNNLKNNTTKAQEILSLADNQGKGWLATLISNELNVLVNIPEYILRAIIFASRETLNIHILFNMVMYSLKFYTGDEEKSFRKKLHGYKTQEEKETGLKEFCSKEVFQDDIVKKLLDLYYEGAEDD